jgi:hypothetical protein
MFFLSAAFAASGHHRVQKIQESRCHHLRFGLEALFAFNGRSSDATAIDAERGTVAGTVTLEGKPEFAAADGAGHVYVNIEDTSKFFDIDARRLTVEHRWPLAPCESPSGMAIDAAHRRIFPGMP